MVIFFMASTLDPQAHVSIYKVRVGTEGYSCKLKVLYMNKDLLNNMSS